jgi:hypothetical protein
MFEQIYRFGHNQAENEYLVRGWGQPEAGFVWSEGSAATVSLPASVGDIEIGISIWGYVTTSLPKQQVLIFVNGLFKGYHEVSQREILSIQHDCGTDERAIELTFYIPTATSPMQLEGAPDYRKLGIAIAAIRIVSAQESDQ